MISGDDGAHGGWQWLTGVLAEGIGLLEGLAELVRDRPRGRHSLEKQGGLGQVRQQAIGVGRRSRHQGVTVVDAHGWVAIGEGVGDA